MGDTLVVMDVGDVLVRVVPKAHGPSRASGLPTRSSTSGAPRGFGAAERRPAPHAWPAPGGGSGPGRHLGRLLRSAGTGQRAPSVPSGLTALSRALALSDDERDHLFLLADQSPKGLGGPSQEVRPGILRLLDRLDDAPAMVLDAAYTILACNPFIVAIYGADPATLPPDERNIIWRSFTTDPVDGTYDPQSLNCFRRDAAADLRAAAARYPRDPGIRRLVERLLAVSSEFAQLWHAHDVQVRRSTSKRLYHPQVGFFDVDSEALHIPESDQRLVIYSAAPGSPGRAALDLVRVVGTQTFSAR